MKAKGMAVKILLVFCSFLICSSCAVYHTDFDCPPDVGVPCTSSSDIESMITETKEGPDIFTPFCTPTSCLEQPIEPQRKIWMCPHLTDNGHQIQGHYVYLNQDCCSESEYICCDPTTQNFMQE